MNEPFRYQLQTPRVAWAVFKDWFWRGKTLWVLILTSALIFFSMYLIPAERMPYQFGVAPPTLADRIRWMGMLFQFVGVLVIVFSLRGNLRLFGENSMSKDFFRWLLHVRFVVFRMPPISASMDLRGGSAEMVASGMTVLGATASLEERVTWLQRMVEEIQKNIGDLAMKHRQFEREMKRRFEAEAEERKRGDSEVERKLKTTTVGGVALQLSGVFYLLVGIMFTSIPDGVAFTLQKFGG